MLQLRIRKPWVCYWYHVGTFLFKKEKEEQAHNKFRNSKEPHICWNWTRNSTNDSLKARIDEESAIIHRKWITRCRRNCNENHCYYDGKFEYLESAVSIMSVVFHLTRRQEKKLLLNFEIVRSAIFAETVLTFQRMIRWRQEWTRIMISLALRFWHCSPHQAQQNATNK